MNIGKNMFDVMKRSDRFGVRNRPAALFPAVTKKKAFLFDNEIN